MDIFYKPDTVSYVVFNRLLPLKAIILIMIVMWYKKVGLPRTTN